MCAHSLPTPAAIGRVHTAWAGARWSDPALAAAIFSTFSEGSPLAILYPPAKRSAEPVAGGLHAL